MLYVREGILNLKYYNDFNASLNRYSCFPTLETYYALLNDSGTSRMQRWDIYSKRDDCQGVAASTVRHWETLNTQGEVSSAQHFNWDLQSLMYHLKPQNDTKFLLVRTEHLVDDWISANRYLGEVGNIAIPTRLERHSSDIYPVKKDLSEEGRKSLCFALENEYRTYFSLIVKAENVSNRDVSKSLNRAKRNCPWLDLNLTR